ncbi:Non-specific lipid transfer protein-like 1 [Morella rubra]|uniref:Non-specific lipid transfer protein-like 1 n=1 Tax=Morella rubra TaxID=262757 RepID=A0A6A1VVS1_9ROSI|nr:Non-specific lipid transfer protein-like 1 [Morella rubra]
MGCHNSPILLAVMVLLTVGLSTLVGAQNTPSCAQKLVPCANYINSSTPAASCCNSIKEAVDTQLACLCGLYTTPGLLQSLGITVEQALHLSRACGVTTDLSKCNATAPSPASSVPPPPAVPGNDGVYGASRIGFAGLSILFFFMASMLFY